MWWCQIINWIKFATHPSPLLDFKVANGLCEIIIFQIPSSCLPVVIPVGNSNVNRKRKNTVSLHHQTSKSPLS